MHAVCFDPRKIVKQNILTNTYFYNFNLISVVKLFCLASLSSFFSSFESSLLGFYFILLFLCSLSVLHLCVLFIYLRFLLCIMYHKSISLKIQYIYRFGYEYGAQPHTYNVFFILRLFYDQIVMHCLFVMPTNAFFFIHVMSFKMFLILYMCGRKISFCTANKTR